MKESLAKRLIFFGRLIIILSFLSFVCLLQKFDAHDLNLDVLDLSLLYSLREFDDKDITYTTIFEETDRLIKNKDEKLYEDKQNLRQKVYEWLVEREMDMEGFRLSGKIGSARDIRPYIFFEYDVDIIKRRIGQKTRSEYSVTQTVGYYLERLDVLASPGSINVACETQSRRLPDKRFRGGDYKFGNTYLRNTNLEIRYVICPPGAQQGCPDEVLELPVKVKRIERPSILHLTDEYRPQNRSLEDLFWSTRKDRLNNQYGHLRLEEARSIASDELTKAYQSINVLGFSFSTQRFPFALLFLYGICLIGSLATLKIAKRSSIHILSEVTDENAIDLLINHLLSRLILWVVLPVVSIIISFPITPLPIAQTIMLLIGVVVLFALGVISFLMSRNL